MYRAIDMGQTELTKATSKIAAIAADKKARILAGELHKRQQSQTPSGHFLRKARGFLQI